MARYLPLELVTVPAPGIVHRTLVPGLVRIGRRRILGVTISFVFLVGILINSHIGLPSLLLGLPAASVVLRIGRIVSRATAVPQTLNSDVDLDLLYT